MPKYHLDCRRSPCCIAVDTNIRILHNGGTTASYTILVTSLFYAVTCRVDVTPKTWMLEGVGGGNCRGSLQSFILARTWTDQKKKEIRQN